MRTGVYRTSDLPRDIIQILDPKSEHVLFDRARGGGNHFFEVDMIQSIPSERQLIEIVRSPVHGHILVLDGEVQLASFDEHKYHGTFARESLAFADSQFPKPSYEALIFGGGDGCLARELLATERLSRIQIIDYDKDVIGLFSQGEVADIFGTRAVFASETVNVFSEDYRDFEFEAAADRIDILFFDLTDTAQLDETAWADEIVRLLEHFVGKQGQKLVVALQLGSILFDTESAKLAFLLNRLNEQFAPRGVTLAHAAKSMYMPSFSAYWSLGFVALSCP